PARLPRLVVSAQASKAPKIDARLRTCLDDLREDAVAPAAAHDDAGAAKDVSCADLRARPAGGAGSDRRGHLPSEDLLQQARDCVAVEHECVHPQPPVGPKRSVLMECGSWPRPTSVVATASTNGVGPQMYTTGASVGAGPTSSNISASTRREDPLPPPGCERGGVGTTVRP